MKSAGMFSNLWVGVVFAAICAAVLAPGFAEAAEYVPGTTQEIVLMTGSADGTTNTLAEAITAYNTAHETSYDVSSFNGGDLKDYAIVKEGDGTLVMDTAIQSFTGPIVINDGVVQCMCRYALGADVAAHHTYVRAGATLWFTRISTDLNVNRTLHIIGTGHNDQGALRSHFYRPSYSQNNVQGGTIYLDGDTTIANPWWGHLTKSLFLQNHTLTIFHAGNSSNRGDRSWLLSRLEDDGKIVMNNTYWYNASANLISTNPENKLDIGNDGGFKLWQSYFSGNGKDKWLLNFTGATGTIWGDANNAGVRGGNSANTFWNPVHLSNTTLKVITQGNVPAAWVKLHGPVSGTGGIDLEYLNYHSPFQFSLANPNNSFTGTVRVDKGRLYVHGPGSLPSTVSVVVDETGPLDHGATSSTYKLLSYHGVEFVAPGEHNLGPLTFKATAYQNQYYSGRIQGGYGTFSEITKSTTNTMEYYSSIGSPLLNVQGGTVKLPRGAAPGLWEGTNTTEMAGGKSGTAIVFDSRACATNYIALGPNAANNTAYDHYMFVPGWSNYVTYNGYIWNRSSEPVTWTFASSVFPYIKIYIDGEPIVSKNCYNIPASDPENRYAQVITNVTLSSGPHTFEYRGQIPQLVTSNNWAASFGFVIDKQGRGSSSPDDYEIAIDSGDGSFFTRSVEEADLPHFDEMRFADGTTLDLNGNAYVAGSISGFPNVISSAEDGTAAPSLTINNRFIVNAADLVVGSTTNKLSLAMPLAFGADAGVTVTNLGALARGTYTLAEVTGAGNALSVAAGFRQRCELDSRKWAIRVSETAVELTPSPGLVIMLR